MPPIPATGARPLSSPLLGDIALDEAEAEAMHLVQAAQEQDCPIRHATGVASAAGTDLAQASTWLSRWVALGVVPDVDVLVPRRWDLLPQDVPRLDSDPARPRTESRRHDLDRDCYIEILARWRLAEDPVCWPRDARPPDGRAGVLTGSARRRVLARLRDPARPGGALLWPWGAIVLVWPGEVARARLLPVGPARRALP